MNMKLPIELQVMHQIDSALELLKNDEPEAIDRVLDWAKKKFGSRIRPFVVQESGQQAQNNTIQVLGNEIPGIARINTEGEFVFLCTDPKAATATDAATRVAMVVIYAYELLTGKGEISSRNVLTPILKNLRLYDGNSRVAISNHEGIIRDKDMMSLDFFARDEAEKIINEIHDPNFRGKWNPKLKMKAHIAEIQEHA